VVVVERTYRIKTGHNSTTRCDNCTLHVGYYPHSLCSQTIHYCTTDWQIVILFPCHSWHSCKLEHSNNMITIRTAYCYYYQPVSETEIADSSTVLSGVG